MHILFNLTA